MNLTYDDGTDDSFYAVEARARDALRMAYARHAADMEGVTGGQALGGFFKSIANSIKRTITFPLDVAKATLQSVKTGSVAPLWNAHKAEAQAFLRNDARQIAAPILTAAGLVIPVLAGAGAALKAAGDYQAMTDMKKSALIAAKQADAAAVTLAAQQGNDMETLKKYASMQGVVPGRVFGASTLDELFHVLGRLGAVPGYTGEPWPSLYAKASQQVQATADELQLNPPTASHLASEWYRRSGVAPSSHDAILQQWEVDRADALLAEKNPAVPLSYGFDAAAALAAPASANAPAGTQVIVPAAAPAVASTGVDPTMADNFQRALSLMAQQGADNAAMIQSATQALQARGVDTSAPAVQTAIASDVKAAQVATAGGLGKMPGWLVAATVAGALFMLARPAKHK